MLEIILFSIFVIVYVACYFYASYWTVGKVFYEDAELSKANRVKVSLLMPFAIFSPLLTISLFDADFYYFYLITFPVSIYILKLITKNFEWNFSKLIKIYFSLFGKFIAASILFGFIAKLLVSVIKLLK